jgi:hypothetical protein
MTDTRLTLRQAAAVLNVSESAIRKRVERGTLRSDKGADGKRYVYLDTVADNLTDEGADASATPEHDALISELRAHNGTLREQLEAERQAHAEARRIIAGLVERIPAIEAPQEGSEAASTVEEEPEMADSPSNRATTAHMDEATNTERNDFSLRRAWLGTLIIASIAIVAYLVALIATGELSLPSAFYSVLSAFSSVATSGLSAVTGDQIVTIISTIIGVIGTLLATYLTIRATRGARDRR